MKVLARKTIGQVGYGNWWTFVLSPKFGWCPEISKTGRFPRWAKPIPTLGQRIGFPMANRFGFGH